MEGPAADEAEARADQLERGGDAPEPETRAAVYGATQADPESHFLGWLGEVDPDELFASGTAWGVKIVRRNAHRGIPDDDIRIG